MKHWQTSAVMIVGLSFVGCFNADGGQLTQLSGADAGADQCGVERPCETGSICHPTGVCIRCPGGRCGADSALGDSSLVDGGYLDSGELFDSTLSPEMDQSTVDASIRDAARDDMADLTDTSMPDQAICIPADETCNQLDDDCDGQVDEDFDLNTNVDHCGACNRGCLERPNAVIGCASASCGIERCSPGYFDRDGELENGCEDVEQNFEFLQPLENQSLSGAFTIILASQGLDALNTIEVRANGRLIARRIPAPRIELTVEENEVDEGPIQLTASILDRDSVETSRIERIIQIDRTPPTLRVLRPNAPIFDQSEPFRLVMSVDDQSPPVNMSIRIAGELIGELNEPPYEVMLDPVVLGSGVHVLNVSARDSAGNETTIEHTIELSFCRMDAMVVIPGRNVEIDQYEASRPDASELADGTDERISCSQAGVLPWAGIDYFDAVAICEQSGKRLCDPDEWQRACEGIARRLFPYDGPFDGQSCNGQDLDPFDDRLPTGFLEDCSTPEGAMDMSGNLAEWTEGNMIGTGVSGGDFRSQRRELQCDGRREYERTAIRQTHGFRCCRDLE